MKFVHKTKITGLHLTSCSIDTGCCWSEQCCCPMEMLPAIQHHHDHHGGSIPKCSSLFFHWIMNSATVDRTVTDEVSSVYKLAAVEHAVLGSTLWANLLDINDLEILEFASDLKVCSIFFTQTPHLNIYCWFIFIAELTTRLPPSSVTKPSNCYNLRILLVYSHHIDGRVSWGHLRQTWFGQESKGDCCQKCCLITLLCCIL